VDFRKAFDSVHRGSLWELLRLRGIPEKIPGLICALYAGIESAIRYGAAGYIRVFSRTHGGETRMYPRSVPVQCVYGMANAMGHTVSSSSLGASFGDERSTDLDFADDAVSFAETLKGLVVLITSLDVLSWESKSED
jgi:hypothetical protein